MRAIIYQNMMYTCCLVVIIYTSNNVQTCNGRKLGVILLLLFDLRYGLDEDDIIILDSKDEFLLPGFIDSHIHASQFPNAGTKLLSMENINGYKYVYNCT